MVCTPDHVSQPKATGTSILRAIKIQVLDYDRWLIIVMVMANPEEASATRVSPPLASSGPPVHPHQVLGALIELSTAELDSQALAEVDREPLSFSPLSASTYHVFSAFEHSNIHDKYRNIHPVDHPVA